MTRELSPALHSLLCLPLPPVESVTSLWGVRYLLVRRPLPPRGESVASLCRVRYLLVESLLPPCGKSVTSLWIVCYLLVESPLPTCGESPLPPCGESVTSLWRVLVTSLWRVPVTSLWRVRYLFVRSPLPSAASLLPPVASPSNPTPSCDEIVASRLQSAFESSASRRRILCLLVALGVPESGG